MAMLASDKQHSHWQSSMANQAVVAERVKKQVHVQLNLI